MASALPIIQQKRIATPKPPPRTFWGTPEEQKALDFYITKTGPWLANYGPRNHRILWEQVVPRVAIDLPATRYLLTAIALLETPAGTQDPHLLKSRSQLIMRNYTHALHQLTILDDFNAIDTSFAPMLGWLLESLTWNESRASMHASGAQHTLLANSPTVHRQTTHDEYIFDEKMSQVLTNIQRFRCMRCKVKRPLQEDTQIFLAVAMRNTPCQPARTEDVRRTFRTFIETYNPHCMLPKDIKEAEDFARRWEVAVVRSRHTSSEAAVLFNALHFLTNVVVLLLPLPVVNAICGEDTMGFGVDYVIDQTEWLVEEGRRYGEAVEEGVRDVLDMILGLLAKFGPDEARRRRAEVELRKPRIVGDGKCAESPT